MRISRKKLAGYRLYGILYRLFTLFPVDGNRAYFIMTHDSSSEGNCGVMKKLMKDRGFKCDSLTRKEASSAKFIFRSAYRLARSRFIFCDNTFLPLSCLTLRKGSTLTQLWHGTGTIKKFGQDVNKGELARLEARCGRNISNLVVSSEATKKIYAGCFSVPEKNVLVLGLPRTDAFFDDDFAVNARTRFEEKYPSVRGKILILYAPTFRDDAENETEQIHKLEDLTSSVISELPDNVCLGLRLHPYVSSAVRLSLKSDKRILDLTHFRGLNTLLGAADILITDYSSIVFEYSLLRRPMLFYAYDLAHFEESDRGFYRDYRSYVPGPVYTDLASLVRKLRELNEALSSSDTNFQFSGSCMAASECLPQKNGEALSPAEIKQIDSFVADSFAYTDGRSAERLLSLLLLPKA